MNTLTFTFYDDTLILQWWDSLNESQQSNILQVLSKWGIIHLCCLDDSGHGLQMILSAPEETLFHMFKDLTFHFDISIV